MRIVQTVILGAAPLMVAAAFGQDSAPQESPFSASVGMGTQQSDNARKQEANGITERQDDFNAAVAASWQGGWSAFEGEYRYGYKNYSKDSQTNRNTLEGRAELLLGLANDPLSLAIRHSNQAQYNTPEDLEISDNLDEKQIWGAEPTLRLALSRVDTLAVAGSYEDVSYRYNELRNSERAGGSVYWSRQLSRTDMMRLTVGTIDVTYPNSETNNFEKSYAHLTYSAALRQITYSLMAGVNQATFEDSSDTIKSPTYRASISYQGALHTLSLNASQEFTDSSYGAGLDQSPVPGNPSDGVGVDQIERKQIGLTWQTTALCTLCTAKVFLQVRDDNYRRLDEDNTQPSAGLTFAYRLTEAASVSANYTRRQEQFDAESKSDLNRDNAGISFDYGFTKNLDAKAFYTYERRQYVDGDATYEENVVGVSMNYTLK
ncbi:hypothetical protein L1F30_14575 [Simiduia sp. 21SJ11W-1]|uniref:hypothetical protein n=1 Tax=Simiduia sp. 21SJ11W-1 TaxID=2909669 RepID=UPI00209F0877|nr:hypothetical protein [Simiduia sp. 21SJ11W-1]UTA47375.1 hypothetical protein L1F30_14575 [Simiduia sp. 21SJ11W-1]